MSRSHIRALVMVIASLSAIVVPKAAVYQEVGGVVVIEAEHFDKRVADPADPNHNWKIVPDEDPGTGDGPDLHARGGKYIESLPDAGQNKNSDATVVGTEPYVEYKAFIKTTGTYRLWIRWAGWDGGSDSLYAQVRELRTSVGGPGPEWYRYIGQVNPPDDTTIVDFALVKNTSTGGTAIGWNGDGGVETVSAGGGEVAANFKISDPGVYTIRISQREDGSAVDAVMLALASLPQPTDPGPAESAVATSYIGFPTPPLSTNVPPGSTVTFTVNASGSGTVTYQWQKAAAGSSTFTDIVGATSASYTTPVLSASDNGLQYRVNATVPGLTLPSPVATIGVDVTPPSVAAIHPITPGIIKVIFSEPVQAGGATNKANFTLNNGVTVSSVAQLNPTTVQIRSSDQTLGSAYTLGVSNIKDIIGNTLTNTNVTFNAVTVATGAIRHRFFANFLSGNPDDIEKDPRYPDNPTFQTLEPLFEYPPNGGNGAGDNYGNELSGWLVPPTDGDYIFYLSSDDQSNLYLSTDEDPANKKLIAQETQWSNSRQWTSSGGPSDVPSKESDTFPGSQWPTPGKITLKAGKRYYIQALHRDGTGGDDVGVAWSKPGESAPNDGDPPIPASVIAQFVGAGAFPDVSLVSSTGSGDFGHATITFSGQLDPASATNKANYSISGLTVTGATLTPNGQSVVLTTSKQAGGTNYTVTVSNVKDLLGRTVTGNLTTTFAGYVLAKGGVVQNFFAGISSANLDTFRSDDRFPNSPTFTTIEPVFEYPPNAGNEAGDNYGNTLSGLFAPPSDGNYVFFVTSDDQSDLFLSTDEDPANKKLIAQETAWSNPRQYTASAGNSDLTSKRSDQFTSTEWPGGNTITLSASKKYYIEAQHVEGGGGDNVSVAFKKVSDPDPTVPIDGSFIVNYLPPASVTITQQPPATVTAVQSKTATFTVGVATTGLVTYQWQKAAPNGGQFIDIAGATGASYTTPLLTLADNNFRYRVIVTGVGSSATSNESVLTVTPDTTAPTVLYGLRTFGNASNVLVKFSEPLGSSAATAGNFKINGTAATGATLGSDLQTVTLTFGSAVSSNASLAISGVSDLAGNTVAANTSVNVGLQKAVLLAVADATALGAGDTAVQQHLISRGIAVTPITATDIPDDGTSTANGYDLIIESSTVSSGNMEIADPAGGPAIGKFKNTPVPAMDWEASSQDAFGFRADNGTTSNNQTDVNIVDATAPLAAGLPVGPVTVVTSPQTFSQGGPPIPGAHIVGTLTSDPTQAVLYYYDKGEKGYNSFVMPERRVFFFFQDTTAAAANDNGLKIFDATVDWLMHVQSNNGGGTQPNASISISGNSVTVNSDNGGTVQATDSLSPANWTDLGPAPQVVQIGSTKARFFRIKK